MKRVRMQHIAKRSTFRGLLATCALAGVIGMSGGTVQARGFVVVNGELMGPTEIAYLEALHCGPIADGYYLINWSTGAWAYPNDLWARGLISDNCAASAPQPSRPGPHRVYEPGEIISGVSR
jgi:hypothetical protein